MEQKKTSNYVKYEKRKIEVLIGCKLSINWAYIGKIDLNENKMGEWEGKGERSDYGKQEIRK